METKEFGKMEKLENENWWYLGRRYVIKLLFKKYSNPKFDYRLKILDVGCGTGEGSRIIDKNCDIYGIDPSDEAIRHTSGKDYVVVKKEGGDNISFRDGEFDCVFMFDVLEHIENDNKALEETVRVLSIGGILFITVPAHQWLWSGHDEVFGHKRRYTKDALIRKVKQVGFEIMFESYYVSFPFPAVVVYRFVERLFRNKRSSHFFGLPILINKILLCLMMLEGNILARGWKLPFGSSVVLIAKK